MSDQGLNFGRSMPMRRRRSSHCIMAVSLLTLLLMIVGVDASSGSKGVVVNLQASWESTSLLHEAAEFLVGVFVVLVSNETAIALRPEAFFGVFVDSSGCIGMN